MPSVKYTFYRIKIRKLKIARKEKLTLTSQIMILQKKLVQMKTKSVQMRPRRLWKALQILLQMERNKNVSIIKFMMKKSF
jgi:hypothetical protein